MATVVFNNAKVLAGGYDLSGQLNEVNLQYEAEQLDDTHFGDSTRKSKGGLKVAQFGMSGHLEYGDAAIDNILFANVGRVAASEPILDPITISPEGGEFGTRSFIFKPLLQSITPVGGDIGELIPFTAAAVGRDGKSLIRAQMMHDLDPARTGSGVATVSQLGAIAAGQTMYMSLHVIAVSGSSPTLDVIVESDDNSGITSGTTRITAAQMTGIGSQYLTLAGPITDDYWRVGYTLGGSSPSFTFAVALGIA